MNTCFPDKTMIARKLLAYLSAHPDAQDTAEGISRGWLPEGMGIGQVAVVKEVLEDLVTQGLLDKASGSDGRTSYRRHGKVSGTTG